MLNAQHLQATITAYKAMHCEGFLFHHAEQICRDVITIWESTNLEESA